MSAVTNLSIWRATHNKCLAITDDVRIKNAVVNRVRLHHNWMTMEQTRQVVEEAQRKYGAGLQMDRAIREALDEFLAGLVKADFPMGAA
jgi:hypothetical protein